MSLTAIQSSGVRWPGNAGSAKMPAVASSPFAGLLRGFVQSQVDASTARGTAGATLRLDDGTSIDVGQIRALADRELENIRATLTKLLAEQGIEVRGGVRLQVDGDGQAHVAGSGQPAVEAVLGTHPELEPLFASAVGKARVLRAAEVARGSGGSAEAFDNALTELESSNCPANLLLAAERLDLDLLPAR